MTSGVGIHPLSSAPNKMWELLSPRQKVEKVQLLAHDAPKPPNHTRFVCISGECVCVCVQSCKYVQQ